MASSSGDTPATPSFEDLRARYGAAVKMIVPEPRENVDDAHAKGMQEFLKLWQARTLLHQASV